LRKGRRANGALPPPSAYRYRSTEQCAEKRVFAQIIRKLRKHSNLVEMDAPPNDNANVLRVVQ